MASIEVTAHLNRLSNEVYQLLYWILAAGSSFRQGIWLERWLYVSICLVIAWLRKPDYTDCGEDQKVERRYSIGVHLLQRVGYIRVSTYWMGSYQHEHIRAHRTVVKISVFQSYDAVVLGIQPSNLCLDIDNADHE